MSWQQRIIDLKTEHPLWGRVKLRRQLLDEGFEVTQHQVQMFIQAYDAKNPKPPTEEVLLDPSESVTQTQRHERELDRLKTEIRDLRGALQQNTALSDIWTGLTAADLEPPKWLAPKRSRRGQSIASATLADAHLDEVVNPAEIEGLNCYNRAIAELRLQKFFQSVIEISRDYVANVDINGLVLKILGDMVSGNIHEELKETNEALIIPSVLHWTDQLAAGIQMMADHFGRIHVVGVVGNHGRNSKKPRSKGRVEDNFDFLIYSLLAKHFAGISEISVQVPKSADADLRIYDVRYRATHGDQFRGGSGIAGALSPLMLGDSRKRKRANQAKKPYDFLVLGHWHQYLDVKGIICSPALKGYDEYSYLSNFEYEPPGGCWWITDSKKGRTLRTPVHVQSDKEDWGCTGGDTDEQFIWQG